MIKRLFLSLAIYTLFSNALSSQAFLISEDCGSLTANFKVIGAVPTPSTNTYSFILEKEVLPNLWQKTKVVNTSRKEVRFSNLPQATYRVTIISPTYFITQKTKLYQHLVATEKGNSSLANTFLSNTVVLDLGTNCETGHTIISKHSVQTQQTRLLLYPNPTQNKLWVKWNESVPIKMFSIYNLTGKLLQQITTDTAATIELNLSDLEPGIYLLKATDGQTVITTKRISVIR